MRGRWIRPEFWTSRTLAKVSRDARLLFVGLWTYADDEGRAPADLTLIRAALFPLDEDVTNERIAEWMLELAERRLIVTYRARARAERRGSATELVQIRAWSEHQSVSHARESLYPGPPSRKRRSGDAPETLRSRSVPSSREVHSREVVADSGGAPEPTASGVSPNGAGGYDPDATYVPGPDEPRLFEDELQPEEYDPETGRYNAEPVEPSSEPRSSPSRWRDPDYNPWSSEEATS